MPCLEEMGTTGFTKPCLYHTGPDRACEILVTKDRFHSFSGMCTSICGNGMVMPASSNFSFTASVVSQNTPQ